MGTEGVSKVMMIGGGTLGFSGFGGVAYTRGSVGTRWIWSAHIGVALSWRHWTCVDCVEPSIGLGLVFMGVVVDTHGGTRHVC